MMNTRCDSTVDYCTGTLGRMTLEGCRGHLGNKMSVVEEAQSLKSPNLSPHLNLSPNLSLCPHCPICAKGTKLSPGDKGTNLGTNSPVIPMLCPPWTKCPQGQFCPQRQICPLGTILSPMDNILEFCPFVPCIAKFVPFYGDKFGDIAKIQFCPQNDLYSLQGSSCRVSQGIEFAVLQFWSQSLQ